MSNGFAFFAILLVSEFEVDFCAVRQFRGS